MINISPLNLSTLDVINVIAFGIAVASFIATLISINRTRRATDAVHDQTSVVIRNLRLNLSMADDIDTKTTQITESLRTLERRLDGTSK